jgi:hypothetical protein
MLESVGLVKMEELTTHQSAHVHMELLKLNKFVNHVTKEDVKPVPEMLIIVKLVKLTEFNLHQSVHVTMDIGKLLMKNVYLVSLDVTLVKSLKKTVLPVLVLELMPQNVTVQIITSKMNSELALNVLQNVSLVLITNITVSFVPIPELLNLHNAQVLMDNMKLMNTVTIVLTDVPLVSPTITVLHVLTKPEDQFTLVHVWMVTITLVLMLTVQNVKSNVILVLILLITVLNVLQPESKDLNHIVIVNNTNMLTKMVNVMIVTINVTLVKVNGISVLNVKILELQQAHALVQLDIMKLKIWSNVSHVTQDVLNVKELLKIV